jgi:hypothetical protein
MRPLVAPQASFDQNIKTSRFLSCCASLLTGQFSRGRQKRSVPTVRMFWRPDSPAKTLQESPETGAGLAGVNWLGTTSVASC